MLQFVLGVVSAVLVTLLACTGRRIMTHRRDARDRRIIVAWLKTNTRDEPGHSHVDVLRIAKETGLSEERARAACFTEGQIFRHQSTGHETWSVWRGEPQSIYEKRGIIGLGDH